MSWNIEEEGTEGSSHHDENADINPGEEWQPKEEPNPDDGDTHEEDSDGSSHHDENADVNPGEEWQPKEETNPDDGDTHGKLVLSKKSVPDVTRRPVRSAGLDPSTSEWKVPETSNFNAAFLELSRSKNCLRYVPITTTVCSRSFY
ncbi:hypothetical protein HOLleu_05160 [Holothuria leucospilota]|uniref:Uncharacterized protein n=1 Tax=Holothuria leucospilota TaxID=206669 RepID=A0A9Q1CKB7_HOLLE|nr:hypothetical protein HOLleu_05160 [Holothuria leucospilota]